MTLMTDPIGPDETTQLRARLEHAEAALMGDNEGCRLWFLDCAELTAKHRARADAAEARWDALKDYLTEARTNAEGGVEAPGPFGRPARELRAQAEVLGSTLAKMRELEAGK